jgi:hypothetical protein
MYAKVTDTQVVEWPIASIRQRLPQISFPETITNAHLPDGFVFVAEATVPRYDQTTHRLAPGVLMVVDGVWTQTYQTIPLTDEELAQGGVDKAAAIRAERTQKLAESDWTQISDATVDKTLWAEYRQALRDVTKQSGFPTVAIWPVAPA